MSEAVDPGYGFTGYLSDAEIGMGPPLLLQRPRFAGSDGERVVLEGQAEDEGIVIRRAVDIG